MASRLADDVEEGKVGVDSVDDVLGIEHVNLQMVVENIAAWKLHRLWPSALDAITTGIAAQQVSAADGFSSRTLPPQNSLLGGICLVSELDM